MMKKCEISVYIPTHRRVTLLRRAVESVLNQKFSNFEVIVINDGSDPDTISYLKEISEKDNRVVYRSYSESKGACFARNLALSLARGTYITGLDDDDYFSEDRLEKLYEVRALLDQYSFISTATHFFDDDGRDGGLGFNSKTIITAKILKKYNAVGNQVFSLTSRFRKLNGFDNGLSAWQDYDMWLRLVNKFGDGINTKDITYHMDISDRSDRISLSRRKVDGIAKFIEKHNSGLGVLFKARYNAMISHIGFEVKIEPDFLNKVFYYIFKIYYMIKSSKGLYDK
ncbi:glycosyltransferase [Vibrio parahaemolyticus]